MEQYNDFTADPIVHDGFYCGRYGGRFAVIYGRTLRDYRGTLPLSEGNSHIVQYGKYLSTPSRMAGMGKCDIGISSYNEAMRAQKENLPLQIMYPTDGTSWYLYGIGLSADSKEPELGQNL